MTLEIEDKKYNDKIKNLLIDPNISVKEAMRQMNKAGKRILFVVDDEERLLGSLTDGDIRRWVLSEGSLSDKVDKVYNQKPFVVTDGFDLETVKEVMLTEQIEWIPVINGNRRITEILFWDNIFGDGKKKLKGKVSLPVVIMAGGKGTRLDPFTRILPKPLIPIGEKAIIDIIMEKFNDFGVNRFFISVNHKSKMIKAYFEETNCKYKIDYIEEEKPLGTAGSLGFLYQKIDTDLIVSNCDIIIDCDYAEIVKFHQTNNYDITIVASFRHFQIPYGVCTIEDGGKLLALNEKPEYDFLVNTGMYLLKKETLKLIPGGEFFHITDLINKVVDNKCKVGVFPIDEKSWIDIGQWEEYQKSLRDLKIES